MLALPLCPRRNHDLFPLCRARNIFCGLFAVEARGEGEQVREGRQILGCVSSLFDSHSLPRSVSILFLRFIDGPSGRGARTCDVCFHRISALLADASPSLSGLGLLPALGKPPGLERKESFFRETGSVLPPHFPCTVGYHVFCITIGFFVGVPALVLFVAIVHVWG